MRAFLKKNRYSLLTLLSVAVLLAVWEIVGVAMNKDYFLPPFSQVAKRFFQLFTEKNFYLALGNTLKRCAIGFFSAFAAGLLLGLVSGKLRALRALIRPVVSFFRTTPVMALTLLILVWFHTQTTPIIIGIIMVFPVVYETMADAVNSVDERLLQVAQVYDFKPLERVRYLYFSEVAPYVFSAAATSFGLNIKAVVSAEILAYAPRSLGLNMFIAKSDFYEGTALLFAYVLVAVLLSGVFEAILRFAQKRICSKWEAAQ